MIRCCHCGGDDHSAEACPDQRPSAPPMFFSTEFVFPRHVREGDTEMSTGGLSLRDYFAAQAILAIGMRWAEAIGDIDPSTISVSAKIAFDIADAMLKERQR